MWGVGLSRFCCQLKLLLPMLIHRFVNVFVCVRRCAILKVVRGKMRGRACQRPAGEIVLVVDVVRGRGVVGVVMLLLLLLLCVMMRMGLGLELWHLHAKPLMSLCTVQHDMLSLVALVVHGDRVEQARLASWRRTRRGG